MFQIVKQDSNTSDSAIFRYDLISMTEPRIILITDHVGKRSDCPRLGYVVIPTPR